VAANAHTAVVVQSDTPVAMPWADAAPAILQARYGGNEAGHGVADVLFGGVSPSGRLLLTFPRRLADTPALLHFGAERGARTLYAKDVHVGYRWYDHTRASMLFPFGHGLSYTAFALGGLAVDVVAGGETLLVSVTVCNTGARAGAEVVQVYVAQRSPSVTRPVKELKRFSKVRLEAGEERAVEIPVSLKYACSFWDEDRNAWTMERDTFHVLCRHELSRFVHADGLL
jgi:beta-glucosidase